jgi:hypothetical protein
MPSGRVVTAGCGLILDRNGGSKNYHLIDGGSCIRRWRPARQHHHAGADLHVRSRTVGPTNSVVPFLMRPRSSTNAHSRALARPMCRHLPGVAAVPDCVPCSHGKGGPGPRPPIHNKERVLPVSSPDKPRAPRNGSRLHPYRLVLPSSLECLLMRCCFA